MKSHNREPVGETCPDIDKALRLLKSAQQDVKFNVDQELSAHDAKSIMWDLDTVMDILEDLRKANMQLREWGIYEAEQVDELGKEIETINEANENP